ncbi:DUF3592 domain-containing protein [Gracilimonas sediminicola]|uniref:DUF3592 domain-containing protein n=1 Tax=Gracilimonas sediminicola TaxID=2952158 RepID=A0A9X2REH7_9BACT|nr:DUF3592 domain-containing protein [Gracilimonas sediminicola]MCP9291970.1 DUF3592 domain-containing protein [Gracilimonas sediminicola]
MNLPLGAGLAFSLLGIYLLIYALRNHKKALASQNWPKVSGKLVSINLWGKRNIDGQMIDADKLSVKYDYSVHDKVYAGTVVAFYTLMYPETTEFAEDHTTDSPVDVYYNPAEPSESVLIPGHRKGSKRYSDLILAILAVLIGVVVTIMNLQGNL